MPELGDVAADVAAAFGLGDVVAPMRVVARGEQARIWRLDTDAGSFAVKQLFRGFEPRTDGVDIAFQEKAAAYTTTAVTPNPVRRPDGSFIARVAGAELRASTWVDVAAPDTGLDPRLVGELLASLHQVPFAVGVPEVDPWYHAPVGADQWQDLAERLTAADAPFADDLLGSLSALLALESILEQPADLRVCHRDLWADNLRMTPSGRLCVLDWDNCGPADPSHELAMVLYEFGFPDRERMRSLNAAYVAAGGPGRVTRPGHLTMVIAQFGHFWHSAAQGWLDPEATWAERVHQQERVDELLSPPFTVEAAETFLGALT